MHISGDLQKGQTMMLSVPPVRFAEVTFEEGAIEAHFTGHGLDEEKTAQGTSRRASLSLNEPRIEYVTVVALEKTSGIRIVVK